MDRSRDGLRSYVTVDGHLAGVIEFADQLRPHLDRLFAELGRLGIRRTLLLSGDQARYTEQVSSAVGSK